MISNALRPLKSGWGIAVLVAALLVVLPLLIVPYGFLRPVTPYWEHLKTHMLPTYVLNTFFLLAGTAFLTLFLGVISAWLVSNYKFPGSQIFHWALALPIAIPAYISGFTWTGMLDFTSPVYTFLREYTGLNTGKYLFFNLLSLHGAIVVFSLSLYPYVFLIARAYFSRQAASLHEASTSLGRSEVYTFFFLMLPLARPAIAAGLSLVLMEVLNDYGLVKYFGVDTFTTGIFNAWFGFRDQSAAMRLAAWLLVIVLFLLKFEKWQRAGMRYQSSSGRSISKRRMKGITGLLMTLFCLIPFLLGFALPAFQLLFWTLSQSSKFLDSTFISLIINSILLAVSAAALIMLVSVVIIYALRLIQQPWLKQVSVLAVLGYAIPGAVVALGLLSILQYSDRLIQLTGSTGLYISGTWGALVYAYVIRYMAVGYQSIESGGEKVSRNLDAASQSLGSSNFRNLQRVFIPLIRPSLVAGFLLVAIDVLKELPLTLLLRPFNFDTLAIRAFEFASDERVPEAAPAALFILITGLIPLLFLEKYLKKTNNKHA